MQKFHTRVIEELHQIIYLKRDAVNSAGDGAAGADQARDLALSQYPPPKQYSLSSSRPLPPSLCELTSHIHTYVRRYARSQGDALAYLAAAGIRQDSADPSFRLPTQVSCTPASAPWGGEGWGG
jgi:hypothetical protein